MSNTKPDGRVTGSFRFAAIDQYVETYVVSPKETILTGKDMVQWGDGNAYPDYLLELYKSVPTLQAIINGNVDFITGDEVTIVPLNETLPAGFMNHSGETIREQVRCIAKDFEIYGGFCLQVVRDLVGRIAEVHYIDMRFIRTNKEGDVFYYCEDWNKRGKKDVITYPAYMHIPNWDALTDEQKNANASSIVFVKDVHTQVYPAPRYGAAVKACEIERMIDDFHISDVNNHFVSSAIINFNNGEPSQEMKDEVENEINEKFCGAKNGGRIMVSWNPNKESATDIIEFKVEDFGERYKALSEHSRQQIFTSFRANPNLFGIPTEGNGFANEQYEESFRLYNRTQIRPIQRLICDTYDWIYGQVGVLNITPFSLDGTNEQKVN
jgi:hypothetical protein